MAVRSGLRLIVLAMTAALVLLSAARLGEAVVAIGQLHQIDYGEPILYSQAARLLRSEPLYAPLDRAPYSVTAYTPLFYYLAAGVQAFVGGGFLPGRVLSMLAGVVGAVLIGLITRRAAASWWAGLLAGLLFLGQGFVGFWLAFYRVDLVGIALSFAAILVLTGGNGRRQLLAAGVLAGLALLTKQTLFAATLAGTIWLWHSNWRKAALFATTVAIVTGLPLLVLQVTTGGVIANTVLANVNPIALETFKSALLPPLLLYQLVPALFALLFVATHRATHAWQNRSPRLLILYWAFSAVPLIGLLKLGAGYNYWIEFAGATAVLATLAIWRKPTPDMPSMYQFRLAVPTVLFAVYLGLIVPARGYAALLDVVDGGLAPKLGQAADAEFPLLVDRVRQEPADVLADPMDVVALAGRPILLEPIIFQLLDEEGGWNPQPLVRHICSGGVRLLVLGYPIDSMPWPPEVAGALRESMAPAGRLADRFLYEPRPGFDASACEQAAQRAR